MLQATPTRVHSTLAWSAPRERRSRARALAHSIQTRVMGKARNRTRMPITANSSMRSSAAARNVRDGWNGFRPSNSGPNLHRSRSDCQRHSEETEIPKCSAIASAERAACADSSPSSSASSGLMRAASSVFSRWWRTREGGRCGACRFGLRLQSASCGAGRRMDAALRSDDGQRAVSSAVYHLPRVRGISVCPMTVRACPSVSPRRVTRGCRWPPHLPAPHEAASAAPTLLDCSGRLLHASPRPLGRRCAAPWRRSTPAARAYTAPQAGAGYPEHLKLLRVMDLSPAPPRTRLPGRARRGRPGLPLVERDDDSGRTVRVTRLAAWESHPGGPEQGARLERAGDLRPRARGSARVAARPHDAVRARRPGRRRRGRCPRGVVGPPNRRG